MKNTPAEALSKTSEQEITLRKPHEMIVMIPRSAYLTLTARRIYAVLLQISQLRLVQLQAMPPANFMFEAPLAEILKATGSKGGDRVLAKKYLIQMRSIEVDWESTAPGDGIKWRGFTMLSEVALEIRSGQNWIQWSFAPSIMTALIDPQRWARIDIQILASLNSYASIGLYEICARYRDNPGMLTSRKPPGWWTAALSGTPGGDNREWRKFKNERIKPALEEVNSKTDLNISLIEHKKGRELSEIQFSVCPKESPLVKKHDLEPVDVGLVLRAETLGISEPKLDGLVKEFSESQVDFRLGELERRMANTALKVVENSYSYLRSLLLKPLDNSPVRTISDEQSIPLKAFQQVKQPETLEADSPSQVKPTIQVMALQQAKQPEPSTADLPSHGKRLAVLMAELQNLSEIERRHWLNLATQDLSTRGLLTAAVSRRALIGEIRPGILGSKAVEIYAETTYGAGWRSERLPIQNTGNALKVYTGK